MIALIMAGGIGSRFWPLSRENNPKQFLPIVSEKSMIRLTVDRLLPKIKIDDIYVVTAQNQLELVKKHLPELPSENIIAEPFGMNTAPCIALSLAFLQDKYEQSEKMLVAAADHLITDNAAFYECLNSAEKAAEENMLVTFGILPHYPATSYGYIERDIEILPEIFGVRRFKEKPDAQTAAEYLQKGSFFWNSGMFLWNLSSLSSAFRKLQPQIWSLLLQIKKIFRERGFDTPIDHIYKKMPKIPIDIAIMEKSDNIALVPADIGWSDVGSWKALYDLSARDANENFFNNLASKTIDSKGNYVFSDKMVTLIGVTGLVVVETDDVILVMDKNRSEDVKKIVTELKQEEKSEFL